jgi:glycosyltransferase involved in cell wall biosynthesis
MTPAVSVVVPTRNRAALLERLLDALDRQTHPSFEVVVVDDASHDETQRVLNAWSGGSSVRRWMPSAGPGGSYAARNTGWRWAHAPLVAFTDDDCVPEPEWLEALVAALSVEAVGVQGKTIVRDGRITPFTHQIEQLHGGPPYRTCNILYTRAELERQGGFDDSLRWYADNMFGLRARRAGAIPFAPSAVVVHPPRPREWRSRTDWLARFHADARHRAVLRDLGEERVDVGRAALPLVLWIARPLVKQWRAHAAFAATHPVQYVRGAIPMARERVAMVAALRDYWQDIAAPQLGQGREPLEPGPSVSVLIVTRDRPAYLNDVLRRIRGQTYEPTQVVVVDNGDGSARPVAEGHGAMVVPARGETLGAARRAGVERCTGAIVAFTDDDCLPESRWLEELVRALHLHSDWCGVQGRTDAERGQVDRHALSVQRPNRLYHTCNVAYRRQAMVACGGFDKRFRRYFEDTALGAGVSTLGPIGWTDDARIVHRSVPRSPLTRAQWRDLVHDEHLLAAEFPVFYRNVRGPNPTVVLLGRWFVGSAVKALWHALPAVWNDPGAFRRLLRILVVERAALAAVMVEHSSRKRQVD